MKNVSAYEYIDKLDMNALSIQDRRVADKYFDRMESIDSKMFAMKAERRAMADWFLKAIAAQKAKNNDGGDNRGGINGERKTLYGDTAVVQNAQTVAGQ